MLVLVLVLAVTNLASLAALGYLWARPPDPPAPDALVAGTVNRALGVTASSSAVRRVITVEIGNAVELAATRGRMAGLAGSIAPGLVKRVVHDQTMTIMRRQLLDQGVVADVRLHRIDPSPRPPAPGSR